MDDKKIKFQKLTLDEKVNIFLESFTQITKEECNTISEILKWDDETKLAFVIAKGLFEEEVE
jgi:hypothetical protein